MHLEVMIVDDDPIFRLIAGALLKQVGITYPQHTCKNGQGALNLLAQQGSGDKKFLIFLDINMPVLNGWEVLKALKDSPHRDDVYVVMVTSSIDKADKNLASTFDHVIDFLTKPLRREDLQALMKSKPLASFFAH